jgi:prepilin-type N-terminal cleavage/methylation domain-containing protein
MAAGLKKALATAGGPGGFTLIEVIATLIVAGIMGAIFIQFMGTAMSRSTRAVEMVRGEAAAEAIVEEIVADYVYEMNANASGGLDAMEKAVNIDKKYDNSATGIEVTAAYIAFDANGVETADSGGLKRTLKVTVAAPGNDLITLLTKSRQTNSPPVPF